MNKDLLDSFKMIEKYGRLVSLQEVENLETFQGTDFSKGLPKEYVNKAVILDFDDTLRFSVGPYNYPETPNHVRILPNRKPILEDYKNEGYFLLGASNQSCVSRGLKEEDCISCFEETLKLLDVKIDYVFCPHSRTHFNCYCRKPLPGMGAFLILKYKLDPKKCIMVGDSESDKQFAENCGFNFSTAEDFFATTWC